MRNKCVNKNHSLTTVADPEVLVRGAHYSGGVWGSLPPENF